ncbi:MAG: DUF1190 domain-containing protein [Alphaproteobacteria bacterium]
MKRSRAIRLVLLGSVGLVGLAGCDDAPTTSENFFRDPAECRKVLDAASCDSQFADAKKEHAKTAPRFTSREACEDKFGKENCAPLSSYESAAEGKPGEAKPAQPGQQTAQASGSNFFVPLMLGYLGGQLMGRAGQAAQPVYRDRQNTAYTGSRSIGTYSGSRLSASTATNPRVGTSTTQRSGFGGTASRMSGGSGS